MGRRYQILLLSSALCAPAAAPAAEPAAQVGVYAEHRNGNIVYHYEVTNGGAQALRAFRLGCDCTAAPGTGQLSVLPAGIGPAPRHPPATGYAPPRDTVTAPAGWRARIRRPRGANGYWIEWYTPDPQPQAGVAPGATLRGFSVELPRPDGAFLEGEVTFADASAQRLRLLDLQPPRLSLRAQSAHGAGDAASFRIVANASDNRDPQPRVTLAAFEPAQTAPGARPAWIVTYAAVDASGNRATASARLRRPPSPGLRGEPEAGRPDSVSGPDWTLPEAIVASFSPRPLAEGVVAVR